MEMLHVRDWYIVYTNPLREKKVGDLLSQKNIEHYCPMKRAKLQYSSFLRATYEPLFTSYVFVHVAAVEHSRIKLIHEVINLVHWLGKPAIVRNEEINAIKKFLSLYNDVVLEKIPVSDNGTKSAIHSSLIQEKGMAPEAMNGFVKMQLPSLGYALKASVNREFIKTTDTLIFDNDQQLLSGKFAS